MRQNHETVDWRTRAAKIFCFSMLLLGIYLLLRYAKTLIAVVAIVWGVSVVIHSLAERTAKKIKLPRKLLASLYLVLLLALLGTVAFFVINRLFREIEELALWLEENRAMIGEKSAALTERMGRFFSRFSLGETTEEGGLSSLGVSVESMISELIHNAFAKIGEGVTGSLGSMLRATPKALVTVIVTVMACFYVSMDYEGLRDRLLSLLPSERRQGAARFRQKAGVAVKRYLRAYLLLFLLTFFEIFVGLLILGKRYAFLLAFLIALVDILPILGVGTVLVPWAIVMLFLKNYYFGFGLLILYGVVTIVRQIAEPHLVGGSLGIHPLVSLLFLFAGFELFGFFGMILGPGVALICKELLSSETKKSL